MLRGLRHRSVFKKFFGQEEAQRWEHITHVSYSPEGTYASLSGVGVSVLVDKVAEVEADSPHRVHLGGLMEYGGPAGCDATLEFKDAGAWTEDVGEGYVILHIREGYKIYRLPP